jgi:gliding motility-associated-like protein
LKKVVLSISTLLLTLASFGQGLVNNGAKITLKNGVHVVITTANGHFLNKKSGKILVKNDGTVTLRGNWINNSDNTAIATNDGTVLMDGDLQKIQGSKSTSFNNLEIAGTAQKILEVNTLVGGGNPGPKNGVLKLTDRILNLNSNRLLINNNNPKGITRSTGYLFAETTPALGYGTVQWNVRKAGWGSVYSVPFANIDGDLIPFGYSITTSGRQILDSGFFEVSTYPTDPAAGLNNRPLPTGSSHFKNEYGVENEILGMDRFWVLNAFGFVNVPAAHLSFAYADKDWDGSGGSRNTVDEQELRAVRYLSGTQLWDFPGGGIVNPGSNYLVLSDAKSYNGNWVLSNWPSCPKVEFDFVNACELVPIQFTDKTVLARGAIDSTVWDLKSSIFPNMGTLDYAFDKQGFYNITLKARSDMGCWDTLVKQVQVYPKPDISFTYSDTCFDDLTSFVDGSTTLLGTISRRDWLLDNTTRISGDAFTYKFSQTGAKSIQLEVETDLGCIDTAYGSLEIEPKPIVSFLSDPICEENVAQFVNTSTTKGAITTTNWDLGDGTFTSTFSPQNRYDINGIYPIHLEVTNSFGCWDSLSQDLVVKRKSQAAFTYFPGKILITEPDVKFIDQSIYTDTWLWDFGDFTTSDETGPIHRYQDTGKYFVSLITNNEFNCPDTAYKFITIGEAVRLYIPNAFTPGVDNINNTFRPEGIMHGLKSFRMEIYNRWGELLYLSDDINKPWNGIYLGEIVQEGNYMFVIYIKDQNRSDHKYTGMVMVLR